MQTLSRSAFNLAYPKTQPMLYGTFAVAFAPDVLCLVAGLPEGLCALGFTHADTLPDAVLNLQKQFPERPWQADQAFAQSWQHSYTEMLSSDIKTLPIILVGTNFQHDVWCGLMDVALDERLSYSDFTHRIGKTANHYRAVGMAIGRNPVSWLVPCHRIVAKTGGLHGYRWGIEIKRALLAAEIGATTKTKSA